MTQRYEWMPRREKFSVNALWASSLQKRRDRGAWSEEEEASEWRGFRAGVDLRLGVIDTTNVKKNRERKERDNQKSSKTIHNRKNMWKDVQMHGKCMNMWHAK